MLPGVLFALAIGEVALGLTQLAWFKHAQMTALSLGIDGSRIDPIVQREPP